MYYIQGAKMDDIANIDFEGFLDGEAFAGGKAEKYDLEIGSGSFIPGFEEAVEGMKVDDETGEVLEDNTKPASSTRQLLLEDLK